jgi:hypothetical protein
VLNKWSHTRDIDESPIEHVSKYFIPYLVAKPEASDFETAPFVFVYKSTLLPINI